MWGSLPTEKEKEREKKRLFGKKNIFPTELTGQTSACGFWPWLREFQWPARRFIVKSGRMHFRMKFFIIYNHKDGFEWFTFLHQPTHSETPTLNHPRSPRSSLLKFFSSSWTLARFSVLNQPPPFFLIQTGLHNKNLTVVDFGPKERATQVIAQYELTCSCC